MPDKRKHRGPHPKDGDHFGLESLPALRAATEDLSWLLGRGYASAAGIALVGNRYGLRTRQRRAVTRSACTDSERETRGKRRVAASDISGRTVLLDAFNCIIAIEAALSGGVLLIGRDGVVRDMASVHGSYRRVFETVRALELIAATLAEHGATRAVFYIDSPVSNSGRLAALIREHVGAKLATETILDFNPDKRLIEEGSDNVVCSGDSLVLDGCGAWLDLPMTVIEDHGLEVWRLDLRQITH